MGEKTETVEQEKVYSEEHEDNPGNSVSGGEGLRFPMATSFEELEVVEDLTEKTGLLKRVAKRFQMIMNNIISNPIMSPDEKVDALAGLSNEFQTRVGKTSEKQQETKREGGINFPAGDFADVLDSEKPSTWKLRLAEDRPGNITVAQVARAITALQPSGFRGQRVQLGQPKSTVISKIGTAIGKTGGTDAQKDNLRRRLNAVKGLRSGFKTLKGLDDQWYGLGWVTNKWLDLEEEILTDASHKENVEFLNQNPENAPELWTWHIPGTARKRKAIWWSYLNGFMLRLYPLTEAEAKAINDSNVDYAMSHGFYVLKKVGNFIEKYRTFEDSILPRAAAANPWTNFTTLKEILMQKLTEEQRKVAVSLHGEGFVAALEQETADKAALLETAEVQSKEAETQKQEETPVTDNKHVMQALASETAKLVIKELNPQGLQTAIKSLLDLGKQNETAISNITKRLDELEKSDDEKVAKQFEGINWNSGFQASKAEDTTVEKSDPLAQKAPEQDMEWLQGFDPTTQGAQR